LGFKNKRDGRLISTKLQNKTNPHVSSIKMIEIHESSNSDIDRFLVEEDPLSFQTDLDQSYNFVDNLSPCLKHSEGFPGIKLGNKSTFHVGDILVHNHRNSQVTVAQPQCEACLFWIDKYYTDIPILRSWIKSLNDQVDPLKNEIHSLQYVIEKQGKRMKTIGNVILKNVETATAIINSEIM
jgi:hypothetical protein